MKLKKYFLLILLASSLSLVACNKDAEDNEAASEETAEDSQEENTDSSDTPSDTSQVPIEDRFEGEAGDVVSANSDERAEHILKVLNASSNDNVFASGDSNDSSDSDNDSDSKDNSESSDNEDEYSDDDNSNTAMKNSSANDSEDEGNPQDADDPVNNTSDTKNSPLSSNHAKTPTYFDVGDSTVYEQGDYNEAYADEIIALINNERTTFEIPHATKNPSLCIVADVRAKESSLYNGHTRANGTPYYTVAADYFKAENLIVSVKGCTPKMVVDAWMETNNTRRNLLNKDYTSIGCSYFTCGDYVLVAVTFGY